MMKKVTHLFLILFLFISTIVVSQNNKGNITQPELDSGTIENQFDYIITKSSSFKDFQLIRKVSILKVKEHTLDSLKSIKNELGASKKSLTQVKATIKGLESEITSLKNEIELTAKDKDSISIFGNQINKTTYNTIVWSIIVVLTLTLLFFVYQFKNNQSIAKQAKREYSKMEDELDAFKKKAMKKEQELMRKLQDEINKNPI
jgi:septal ring factor EnvC (AmiA/AmiB activator)